MRPIDLLVPAATENPMEASHNREQLPTTRPTIEFPVPSQGPLQFAPLGLPTLLGALLAAWLPGIIWNEMAASLAGSLGPLAPISVLLAMAMAFVLLSAESRAFRKHYIYRSSCGMLDAKTIEEFRKHQRLPRGLTPKPRLLGLLDAFSSYFSYNGHTIFLPGVFASPAGPWEWRVFKSAILIAFVAGVLRLCPFPFDEHTPPAISILLSPYATAVWLWLLTLSMRTYGIAGKAFAMKRKLLSSRHWDRFINRIQTSPDPIERESIFVGLVDSDRSPILYLLNSFFRHAWIVGKTGSGKTAFLMLLLDQFLRRGDVSVVFVDLKATSYEVLASMMASLKKARDPQVRQTPVTHFTLDDGHSSHLFSIFTQRGWTRLNAPQRASIILSALSLSYSRDFGQSYYTDSTYHLLYYVLRRWPDIKSWAELRSRMHEAIRYARPHELSDHVKRDGEHVLLIVERLADLTSLNCDGQPTDVCRTAVDFDDAFLTPRHYYFATGATKHRMLAGEAARLIVATLLTAASTAQQRPTKVLLVIDEFQEMVTDELSLLLTMARSLDIGVLLSNQTTSQLVSANSDLRPIIEGNTSFQAWLQITDDVGREQMSRLGGQHLVTLRSRTETSGSNNSSTSLTESEHIVNRVSGNLVSRIGSDPKRLLLRLTDNDGYACYGDLIFAARTMFHQSKLDYDTCYSMPWPAKSAATLISTAVHSGGLPPPRFTRQSTKQSKSNTRTRQLGKKNRN